MNLSGGNDKTDKTEVQTPKPLFPKPELLILNALYNTDKQTNKQTKEGSDITTSVATSHVPWPIRPDVLDQEPAPKLRNVMATTSESRHVMTAMPESRHFMTTAIESLHKVVLSPVVPALSRPVVPSLVVSAPASSVVLDMVPVWRHWNRRKYLIETDAVYWLTEIE